MQRRTMQPQNAAQMSGNSDKLREVLFEFSPVGNSVKVCAVDPQTMIEATIFGPVSAGEAALKHAALQKLRYLLGKRRGAAAGKSDRFYA